MAVLARRSLQGIEGAHMGRARWLLTDPAWQRSATWLRSELPIDLQDAASSGASMVRAKQRVILKSVNPYHCRSVA